MMFNDDSFIVEFYLFTHIIFSSVMFYLLFYFICFVQRFVNFCMIMLSVYTTFNVLKKKVNHGTKIER